jgi:hypothetical protein
MSATTEQHAASFDKCVDPLVYRFPLSRWHMFVEIESDPQARAQRARRRNIL